MLAVEEAISNSDVNDWSAIEDQIRQTGFATIRRFWSAGQCAAHIAMFDRDELFRSRIDMVRYRFGIGEYGYFSYPLPEQLSRMRRSLYQGLYPIANRLMADLGRADRYPDSFSDFHRQCHMADQTKPTVLLLRYCQGGFNCLHRDLYGPLLFPLQATILLSRRGADFSGGEFMLVENRPRQQAQGRVVDLDRGDMVIFPVFDRPVMGKRGWLRAQMRHGVSEVTAGERYALGCIFHDAA